MSVEALSVNLRLCEWREEPATNKNGFTRLTDAFSLQRTVEQPFKIPFVAAVVLYANEKNGHITGDVLNLLAKKAQNAVKEGAWRSFKLTLRFMACLQDVLEGEGVFPILDELFGQAVDLQTASSDDVRKALVTFAILIYCIILPC